MIEGRRVLAGELILSGAATAERSLDEVIEELVRQHSRLVYRIAYSVLHQHHDAEDATQETFMRVLRYGSKLVNVEDPKTWLARIAWRVAVDRSKRRGNREFPLDDPDRPVREIAACNASAEQALQNSQSGAAVEKLIAALPEKLRAPLILSALQEMSPREIAATLNINEAAVRSRIFRARQTLKEKLARRMRRE
ncbi:MAG TPA: sigma-70 family RNA polymerase sigma factor [Candidatus Sulfotelmatobacter sp.]|nr:sigma-70 family RNA polymerase sigma factor [Candidatus Sulfotelmatobacter sp.]